MTRVNPIVLYSCIGVSSFFAILFLVCFVMYSILYSRARSKHKKDVIIIGTLQGKLESNRYASDQWDDAFFQTKTLMKEKMSNIDSSVVTMKSNCKGAYEDLTLLKSVLSESADSKFVSDKIISGDSSDYVLNKLDGVLKNIHAVQSAGKDISEIVHSSVK